MYSDVFMVMTRECQKIASKHPSSALCQRTVGDCESYQRKDKTRREPEKQYEIVRRDFKAQI